MNEHDAPTITKIERQLLLDIEELSALLGRKVVPTVLVHFLAGFRKGGRPDRAFRALIYMGFVKRTRWGYSRTSQQIPQQMCHPGEEPMPAREDALKELVEAWNIGRREFTYHCMSQKT